MSGSFFHKFFCAFISFVDPVLLVKNGSFFSIIDLSFKANDKAFIDVVVDCGFMLDIKGFECYNYAVEILRRDVFKHCRPH